MLISLLFLKTEIIKNNTVNHQKLIQHIQVKVCVIILCLVYKFDINNYVISLNLFACV